MASVWNPENIRDVAESVGLSSLSNEVVDHLTRDVEFRVAQVLEEALKFMRHAKRKTLFTQDVSQALRVLDVEPLYGYDSTRPLRFGEASIGPGQPLYYLEDEEVDFEKLINAPLPRVPREITFTAHWLAVEGVQPTIPQNPTPAETLTRTTDLLPKGPSANPHLAAAAGADSSLSVKPLVKHILSKEMQLYFDRITAALLDESTDEYRAAALSSLQNDPGLHQLVPYFIQFIAEKVTHSLRSTFILTQILHMTSALLLNPSLYIDPYVSALIPPVLTCLVGRRLGPSTTSSSHHSESNGETVTLPSHYQIRILAASILQHITSRHAKSTPTMKPRLARSLLKHLLAPSTQPLGVYFGAILGLRNIAGADGVRVLILPHLPVLDEALKESLASEDSEVKPEKKVEVEAIVEVAVDALRMLVMDGVTANGATTNSNEAQPRVIAKVGEFVGEKVLQSESLTKAILAQD